MQSIAAERCGAYFAALSLRDWAQVCSQIRPRRCHSRWTRISGGRRTISGKKPSPCRCGRRHVGPFIAIGGAVMVVTVISTIFIGWVSIFAGAFEIVHAFWTKGWGGFVWQVLLGILYIAFGVVLVSQPLASALILTYVLGLVLLISGFVRILLG